MDKRFIAIVLFIAAAVAVIIIVLKKNPVRFVSPPVVVRPAPTFSVPPPSNVSFTFSAQPAIPSSLPIYSVTPASREQLLDSVSRFLSVYDIPSTSASTLVRSETFTRSWSRNGADVSLTIPSSCRASLVFHQQSALYKPDVKQSTENFARQFVNKLFSVPSPIVLTLESLSDGPFDGLLVFDTLGSLPYQGANFSYSVNGVRIVSFDTGTETSSVVVDSSGIVRSATIIPPPLSISLVGASPLISKDQILLNLSQGRGSILSSTNPETAGLGDALTFQSFSIDETTIVYADSDGSLLPAFLLKGHGKSSKGATEDATYFLWASPEPTPTK